MLLLPNDLAQTAADAIANDSAADTLRGHKADAGRFAVRNL
jgi:hypothetical protein